MTEIAILNKSLKKKQMDAFCEISRNNKCMTNQHGILSFQNRIANGFDLVLAVIQLRIL